MTDRAHIERGGPSSVRQYVAHVELYIEDDSREQAIRQVLLKLGATERVGGVHLGWRVSGIVPRERETASPDRAVVPNLLALTGLTHPSTLYAKGAGTHPTEGGDTW